MRLLLASSLGLAVVWTTFAPLECAAEPPCPSEPMGSSSPDDPAESEQSAGDILAAPPASRLAGPRYQVVLPRLTPPIEFLFSDLRYEISNSPMRRSDSHGTPSGAQIARRWRHTVAITRGAFVLRDSLFSQQDHPYAHDPYAILLPPSWISAAVADVSAAIGLRPMCTPPIDEERAWARIREPSVMFGTFPPSLTLFRIALGQAIRGRTPTAVETRNARLTLRALARESAALLEAAPQGAEAVARAGAARIAAADVRYFGRDLRRDRVIPILVENPSAKEQREGKGLQPLNRPDMPEEVGRLVRHHILGARLREGDIAIERYDLSLPTDRRRAADLLRDVIPHGAPPGGLVWLWMAAPRRSPDAGCDEAITAQIELFFIALDAAGVDRSRLRMVRKPDLALAGPARRQAFEAAVARCGALNTLLPVDRTAAELRAWIEASSQQ